MATKTFRAPNMLAALQEIQRDLGPDAIVISMREVPTGPAWQVWNKPGVEVVAATDVAVSRKTVSPKPAGREAEQAIPGRKEIETLLTALAAKKGIPLNLSNTSPNRDEEGYGSNVGESSKKPVRWTPPDLDGETGFNKNSASENKAVSALGDLVDGIISETRKPSTGSAIRESDHLKVLKRRMLQQGLETDFVEHLITTNQNALSPAILEDPIRLKRYMKKQLEASLRPQKNIMAVIPNRVVCVIGATGSGKTSTCAKLAAFYSRTMGKKVAWICADTIRAGAIAETRTYTDVLEVPLFFAYTPQELGEAVRAQADADLILIDTPGVNMLDESKVAELGSYLSEIPNRSLYLTAAATTKAADLEQAVSTLSPFKIKGLIVTKMDETYAYGDIYRLLLKSHLPVMYFTDGPQVLGKLHPGEPEKLASLLVGDGGVG